MYYIIYVNSKRTLISCKQHALVACLAGSASILHHEDVSSNPNIFVFYCCIH
ncbi:hypothetical protein Hanom_Chr16g01456971 [Helianthus anomalus]